MSYSDLWVCTDCYFAHHYGSTPTIDGVPVGHDEVDHLELNGNCIKWFAGESDTPCDREPLGRLDDRDISANVCADHYYNQPDDAFEDGIPCEQCGTIDAETGIIEFSWQSCQGCGSTLGGSRYRLAIHDKEDA